MARRLLSTVGPTLIMALGATVVASAQSSSPFANKKKTQAWEQPQAAQPTVPPQTPPKQAQPTAQPYQPPTHSPASPGEWSTYTPSTSETSPQTSHSQSYAPQGGTSPQTYFQAVPGGQTYRVQGYQGQPDPAQPYRGQVYGQSGYAQQSGSVSPQGHYQYQSGAGSQGYGSSQLPPQRWQDRLGLSSLKTLLRGRVLGGVGARNEDGWEEVFVGDADVELEVSAITQQGLEYGANFQARAQYDEGRKGFTRRLPDCPPTLAGCASTIVNGVPVGLRGHTSQFYTTGPDAAEDTQIALESAHLFLRSAYGDVTVGYDDGAAYLFSLGAPTLMSTGASNAPVDYTGLDAVKTVNDASGFAEKVTYTSPRLLGDQIGLGVQFGASYAPDPYVCGVDYCVNRSEVTNLLTPDLEDVLEFGVALDRTFANGMSVEGTFTYARASEKSGLAAFDDLSSYGAGVEVSLDDWTVGGSWLNSNNGLANGDYEAYDLGVTWQPSVWGVTLGYGHATDDLVNLSSDQFMAGLSWEYTDKITLGAGVQYTDRETLRDLGGAAAEVGSEDATAVFIEAGITF